MIGWTMMASLSDVRYSLRFFVVFFLAGQLWSRLWELGIIWHSGLLHGDFIYSITLYGVEQFKNGIGAFLVSAILLLIPSILYLRHKPIVAQFWAYSITGSVLSCAYAFSLYVDRLFLNFSYYFFKIVLVTFSGFVAGAFACLLMQPWGNTLKKRKAPSNVLVADSGKRPILAFLWAGVLAAGAILSSIPVLHIGINIGKYIDVDISKLAEGQMMMVELSRNVVYILRRSEDMLEELAKPVKPLLDPESKKSRQPDSAKNLYRSIKPEIFVAYGICTHRGCAPKYISSEDAAYASGEFRQGQFFCPCFGGVFDLAGRVFAGTPPPRNLEVPAYEFLSENNIRIYYPGFSHYFSEHLPY